jgi:hypothetical protein
MNKWFALMKSVLLAIVLSLVSAIHANGQLIISQYYEGASNDKCIEIFNTTTSAINLTGYNLKLYANGSTTATTINLSGTIPACGVFVVCNSSYSAATVGYAADMTSGSLSHNGDDAIGLYSGSTLLDLFGDIGCDPGTEWSSLAPGTADGNFVRNSGYCSGVTVDPSGACGVSSVPTFIAANWTSAPISGATNLGAHTSTCCGCPGPVAAPTTETTLDTATPACTSALISWTASTTADNVIVVVSTGAIGSTPTDGTAYTASSAYGSGETIGANQFVVYNGSGTSVTVTGLAIGTTYNYAIFGYDGVQTDCEENYLTGGNFGSFTTLSSCGTAEITTLMVNSCSGSSEGTDELIVIQNGDEAINIDDMVISLPNSTWCNSGCGGAFTIGNSPTYLADLNTMAGCTPDLFVYADPIPAGATIIIFTGNPPTTVLDYSANCGAPGAPIYAIFLDNSSITGNFANSGSTIKIIDIDFGNGQSDVVSYIPDDVANVDGGSILYDAAGNPSYYTSTDCVYPLSVRLNSFFATRHSETVELTWSSFAQAGDTHYLIQRSTDGISFETIGETEIGFVPDELVNYSFTDQNLPMAEVIYYRLAIVSENNSISYSGMISVLNSIAGVYYANQNFVVSAENSSSGNHSYTVYSISGNLVTQGVLNDTGLIPFVSKGIFILEIPGLKIRQKIVCL